MSEVAVCGAKLVANDSVMYCCRESGHDNDHHFALGHPLPLPPNTPFYTTPPATEPVHHPSHYGGDSVHETIKCLKAWLTPDEFRGFCLGNAVKYLSRAGKKGDRASDFGKAAVYVQFLLEAD